VPPPAVKQAFYFVPADPRTPGKYFFSVLTPIDAAGAIYAFDVNSADLKTAHRQILKSAIVRVLENRGSISLIAHASTTGPEQYNQALTEARLQNTINFLKLNSSVPFNVLKSIARGETTARTVLGKDNQEDDRWRAVWIRAWDKATPPPAPEIDPLKLGLPGQSIPSVAALGLDIAGLTAAATAAAIGGLVLSCFASMIALPALYLDVQKLAEFNGFVQGYSDAMQDMANGFSDSSLDRKPLSQWPPIKEPEPHLSSNPQPTAAEEGWRRGQKRGARQAYIDVLTMEANPKEVEVTRNGKSVKVKMNGKRFLRGLHVAHKDNVAAKIVALVNEELKKAGKPPWPTR
jgi:hypothetical protein